MGNISDACRKLGVSRRHYYDIKSAIEKEGLEGLLEKSRKAPRFWFELFYLPFLPLPVRTKMDGIFWFFCQVKLYAKHPLVQRTM